MLVYKYFNVYILIKIKNDGDYMNIKREIFENYSALQCEQNEPKDLNQKEIFFKKYLELNILPFIDKNKNLKILEIGCGKGFLLHAFKLKGFTNISGIDLSIDEVKYARSQFKLDVEQYDFLKKESKIKYDLIICKAVLEHLNKTEINDFLEKIKSITNSDGQIIISVPNMDWFFAIHERYMDYTHEIGFTKGSLLEILKIYFSKVTVLPEKEIYVNNAILKKTLSWIRDLKFLLLLYSFDLNKKDYWISNRAIIAYIKK